VALAGARQEGRPAVLGWDWRGEWATMLNALRSAPPYLLAVVAVIAVTLAYQYTGPRGIGVAVGGGYDVPYVHNFHEREDGVAGRWATDAARVVLPGVGARPSTLVISAGPRPDGTAAPVSVVVNGIALGQFTPQADVQEYRFTLPALDYSYGNLTVDLLSTPQLVAGKGAPPVPYGPKVTGVQIVSEASAGFVKPALAPLFAWLLVGPLLYFLLVRLGVRPLTSAGLAFVSLLAGAGTLAVQRLDLALFAPRLAFLLLLAYVLLLLTDLVVPRLFARGGVTLEAPTWRLLQLIFLLALVLKLGGLLYPQIFIIDQPAQNQFFEKILHGRFMELYKPTPGGISSLPGQWGINAQLPYPPFFFVIGLPFYLWPLGKDLSINVWSGLLDCTRPLLIYFLARRLGANSRASLSAAFIMALTPATFLLHSWGNYPTTTSQWFALLFLTLLVARFRDLRRPAVFIGLLLLLALTLLLYTVTAVFIGVLLLVLIAGLAWRGGAAERRQLAPLSGLLIGACVIAFFAYYVQYAGPLLTNTLPAFGSQLDQGQALGVKAVPFPLYTWRYFGRVFYYGLLISLLLTPLGLWRLLRGAHDRLAGPLFAAWLAVFGLFFLAGTRIDMVDKEMWFVLPALAICAGVACDTILRRLPRFRLGSAAVALYLGYLTWAAAALWLFRIMVVRH
jgi:hypothetical protein